MGNLDAMARASLAELFELFHRHSRYVAYAHRRGYRVERWTYARMAAAAAQMARELEACGIAKGDRVLLWGENCAEWVVAFWGCVLRGAVVVPMDRIAAADFASRVAEQVDAKLAIGSRAQVEQLTGGPVLRFETLADTLARRSSLPYTAPPLARTDTLQIIFTSGTTADPKGVVITHGNVLANLEPIASEIEKYRIYGRPFRPIRFLNLLPLSHVFGQFLGLFVPPLLPATVLFQDSLNPSETIRTIRNERISVLVGVPRLLESLRDKLERDAEAEGRREEFRRQVAQPAKGHFLKRWWRFRKIHRQFGWKFWAFICGGAALDSDTEEFWRRLGYAVIQGYGMTETTSLVSVNHPFKMSRGSIGKALPGREIKLDENGEILVRGEGVAAGYWQGRELKSAVAEDEGWLRTGDIGALDADGNLYFKGRKKEVIVTPEGMNIYPEDLESALRRQPEVRDCAVVGLEREGNAVPCAALLLHDGGDAEAVVRRANQSLAEFQHLRHWMVWPEEDFPRTSTQKPRTNLIAQVAQAHLAKSAGAAGKAATPGSLSELIARIAHRSAGELSPDATLAGDLNLSSLDRVELMSAIEDRYQVELNEAKFTLATTVRDLEQMLHKPATDGPRFHYPRWAQSGIFIPIRMLSYYLLAWPATLLLAWPRVRGRENLRGVKHPTMFICNHVSWVDFGFVLFALTPHLRRRLAVAMEGERLAWMRKPPAGTPLVERLLNQAGYWLMTAMFNVFPLPARAGFRESFAFAGDLVDRGFSLAVFPEGMRTRDGQLGPFRTGTGLLVNNLRLPIVPMRISGLWDLKQAHRKRAPRGAVSVTIGKPFSIEPGQDPKKICDDLRQIVASL